MNRKFFIPFTLALSLVISLLVFTTPAMAREHRILDGQTGVITVTPFTVEEEAVADQLELDAANKEAAENTAEARIDRSFTASDKDRVLFEAIFELSNRIIALEGGSAIDRAQLKTWMKNKLP